MTDSERIERLEARLKALEGMSDRVRALESLLIKLAGEWIAGVSDDENCSAPGDGWVDGDC